MADSLSIRPPTKTAMLIPLIGGGLILTIVLMGAISLTRFWVRTQAACVARELRWKEENPEISQKMQESQVKEDTVLQELLDAKRKEHWWSWIVVPKHPPNRGCDRTPWDW